MEQKQDRGNHTLPRHTIIDRVRAGEEVQLTLTAMNLRDKKLGRKETFLRAFVPDETEEFRFVQDHSRHSTRAQGNQAGLISTGRSQRKLPVEGYADNLKGFFSDRRRMTRLWTPGVEPFWANGDERQRKSASLGFKKA